MEINILYPLIIVATIIAIIAIFFILKKYQGYKKGVIIANTKYVKNTKYYKELMRRYKIYKIVLNVCCIVGILLSAVLTSRLNYAMRFEKDVFNRDIMLCMDVSQSVDSLNAKLITKLKDTVYGLYNDRFGITIFDAVPINIIPLTTDYNYVTSYLEKFEKAYITNKKQSYFTSFLYAGTEAEGRGTSLIGDGVAYCANTFTKENTRTKVMILSTDNNTLGKSLVSLKDAANYAKSNNVKIYAIGTANITSSNKKTLQEAVKITDGEYFDFSKLTPSEIVDKINDLTVSPIKANSYIQRVDVPELIFLYLLIVIFVLYLLDWRLKI